MRRLKAGNQMQPAPSMIQMLPVHLLLACILISAIIFDFKLLFSTSYSAVDVTVFHPYMILHTVR